MFYFILLTYLLELGKLFLNERTKGVKLLNDFTLNGTLILETLKIRNEIKLFKTKLIKYYDCSKNRLYLFLIVAIEKKKFRLSG